MGLYDAPSINKYKVGTFKGIDVSVPEDQQRPYRATDALNMIPDASGEVRKRPGVQVAEKTVGIALSDGEKVAEYFGAGHLITCKEETYTVYRNLGDRYMPIASVDRRPTVVSYGEMCLVFMVCDANRDKDPVGAGAAIMGDLYSFAAALAVFDEEQTAVYDDAGGKSFPTYNAGIGVWQWHRQTIQADDPYLTVPTIMIASDPGGGGTPHQPINLLTPWVTESFCITDQEGANTFYLQDPVSDITDKSIRWNGTTLAMDGMFSVELLREINVDEGGGESVKTLRWAKRGIYAEDGFRPAVNRLFLSVEGNKKFELSDDTGAPITTEFGNIPATPKPGEDNLRITHWRAGFRDGFIALCESVCATTYGVGGYKDRLFLGGPGNTVYYSEMEDPFYIGALNYVHTEEGSKVMALDGTAGTLSILTDKGIVLLSGQASTAAEDSYVTNSTFVVSHTFPAPEPVGYNNTAILGGEIVYLSKEGVVAIASKDNYAERYAEYRSALIDRKMLKDKPQRILNFGRYLLIFCAGGICWLLDENQPNKDGNKPYAAHQYEGYRMDGFAADAVFIEDDALKLIRGGEIFQWTDGSLPRHYHDGKDTPIKAFWETPWIYGSNFYKNKIFMRLGVLLGELTDITTGQTVETNTGILVEGKKNDEDWKVFMNEEIVSRTFSFDRIDFRYLTFRGVAEMPAMTRKIKVKKAKRFKLRFSNNTVDQPFILREYGIDYVQED